MPTYYFEEEWICMDTVFDKLILIHQIISTTQEFGARHILMCRRDSKGGVPLIVEMLIRKSTG